MRYADFMHEKTCRNAVKISWMVHYNSLYIIIYNPDGVKSYYPMTNYNLNILKFVGRKIGDGMN